MTPRHAASRARDVMRPDTDVIDHSGAVLRPRVILITILCFECDHEMRFYQKFRHLLEEGWVNFRQKLFVL